MFAVQKLAIFFTLSRSREIQHWDVADENCIVIFRKATGCNKAMPRVLHFSEDDEENDRSC